MNLGNSDEGSKFTLVKSGIMHKKRANSKELE